MFKLNRQTGDYHFMGDCTYLTANQEVFTTDGVVVKGKDGDIKFALRAEEDSTFSCDRG